MKCLCCGKPLREPFPVTGWHAACIRRFFDTKSMPEIELSDELMMALAEKAVRNGITVPGVQKKISLRLLWDGQPRLTAAGYPADYILKPQVPEYRALPESEHLVMGMAAAAGISVVPNALIKTKDDFAYLTRRVDRVRNHVDGSMRMLAMEDFCQLDQRLTRDKYKGSYERCMKVIKRYSDRPGLDLYELFLRLVFCFLTGNSDMHLKNFSLIETAPESGVYMLSPAYDLLPVNVIVPEDPEEFALTMNGKKTNLRRKDFLVFAEAGSIPRKAAETMVRKMLGCIPKWIDMCEESLLPPDMKSDLIELMRSRADRLN